MLCCNFVLSFYCVLGFMVSFLVLFLFLFVWGFLVRIFLFGCFLWFFVCFCLNLTQLSLVKCSLIKCL